MDWKRKTVLILAAFSLAVAPGAFAEGDTYCNGKITGKSVLSNPNAGRNDFDFHLPDYKGTGFVPSREHAACVNEESDSYDGDSSGSVDSYEFYDYSVKGYSWNDNLGYISYNCKDGKNDAGLTDGKDCGPIDYGVYIGPDYSGQRNLFGHAWSPSFGWIQFRGDGVEAEEEICETVETPGSDETVGPVTKGMGEAYSATIGDNTYSVVANLSPSYPAELINLSFGGSTKVVNNVGDKATSGAATLTVSSLPKSLNFTIIEAYPSALQTEEITVNSGDTVMVNFRGSDRSVRFNSGLSVNAVVDGVIGNIAVGQLTNFGDVLLEPYEISQSTMVFKLREANPQAATSGPHQLAEGAAGLYTLNGVEYRVTVNSISDSNSASIEAGRSTNVSGMQNDVAQGATVLFSEIKIKSNSVAQKITFNITAPGAAAATTNCEKKEEKKEVVYTAMASCNPSVGGSPLNVSCTTNGSSVGADSVVWNFGDGTANSSNFEPMHQFQSASPNSPVTHNVTATLTWGGVTKTATTQVLERAPVEQVNYSANATCSPSSGTAPLNLTCTTAGSTEGADSVDWDFKDGSAHSSQATPMHQFQNPGTYNVELLMGWGDHTETANVVVTVDAPACVPTDDVVETYNDGPITTYLPGAMFVSLGDSQYEVSVEHNPNNPDPRIDITMTNIDPYSSNTLSANNGDTVDFGDENVTVDDINQTASVTLTEKWAPLVTTINASDTAVVSGYGEELEVTVLGVYGAPDDASVRLSINGEVSLVDNHTNIGRGGYYLYVDDLQPFYNPPLARFRILEEPGVVIESLQVTVGVGETQDVIFREGDVDNEKTLSVFLEKIDGDGNASVIVSDEYGPVGGREDPIILSVDQMEPLSEHDLTLNSVVQEVTLSFERDVVIEEGVSCPQAVRTDLLASNDDKIEPRVASSGGKIAAIGLSMGLPPGYGGSNSSSQPTFSYGVTMDSDGFLHGYAWTEAGVWMNFEGVKIQLPGQILSSGPGWCDGKPYVCVEVRPNPLKLEFDAGGEDEYKIADGADGYYVHLFLRDGTGQDALVPGVISQSSPFLGSIKINWKDSVKMDQTAKAAVGDSLDGLSSPWVSGNGAVVYKPLTFVDFDKVPDDPGHYVSKEKVRSFAPTDDANLSWTTSTDPPLLVNNLEYINQAGTGETEPNYLVLDHISYDQLLDGNGTELIAKAAVYANGDPNLTLSFRPAIEVNSLFARVLQDVMI
ncbi:MAG: PKD domain-containing protein, partial [bacterium]|nr:PKD domain-containing protein [bacterium]